MRTIIVGGESDLVGAVAETFIGTGSSVRCESTFDAPEVFAGVETLVLLSALESGGSRPAFERLERASRGTYETLNTALAQPSLRRVVIGSNLRLFARHPRSWNVNPTWRPAPDTSVDDLVVHLTELSAREAIRTRQDVRAFCVRFGEDLLADPQQVGTSLLNTCIAADERERGLTPFWVNHHSGTRPAAPPSFIPWKDVLAPKSPTVSRPIRNVVLFGAGGPVGAAAAAELAEAGYRLRLTDIRPLADIARENKPQSPGAPVAVPFPSPHENCLVDVCDADAVREACADMDAVINLTVVRADPVQSFRANTIGAYHICKAAAFHGIRRVVQTGPQQSTLDTRVGYWGDFGVCGDAPARPGRHLYAHSKYLGQEICRVFAERYGLEIPCLLFDRFVNPEHGGDLNPFSISFSDSARAIRAALEVPSLPSPYEEMNICADVPHGVVSPRRATEVLGFVPRDEMTHLWTTADVAQAEQTPEGSK